MADVDVDADEVLSIAVGLRDDSMALDEVSGGLPVADAGVMTGVIENSVGGLLSYVQLLATATSNAADGVEDSALEYHATDTRSAEDLARLMLPGASEREIADAVERTQRADEIELARLLVPGDPDAAEQAVLDSPSAWEEAQQRHDDRDGLRQLLVAPLEQE